MTISTRRAAAVVLALALSVPVSAAPRRDFVRDIDLPQRIQEITKKLQKVLRTIKGNSDVPMPPKP